jgi:iron complex transport system substrate-binding protein
MKKSFLLYSLLNLLSCTSQNHENSAESSKKIITAGGTITEIVHELGFGDAIIATDITSTFPATMQDLPSIGYRNQIKAEGILALGPDLLLIETGYLTNDVVSQLKAAGMEIHQFEKPTNLAGTYKIIRELAAFLNVTEKGITLSEALERDIEALEAFRATSIQRPKMAFIMARGQETVFVAGENTFAESLFDLAGVETVGKGFKDFVPLTPEALVSMDPEYLLFFESGLQSLGGKEGVQLIRGIDQTTAFKNDGILAYDGLYLSGFGPRVGKAALEIAKHVNR